MGPLNTKIILFSIVVTAVLFDLNVSLLDQKEYNKNNHELYNIILYCIIVTKLGLFIIYFKRYDNITIHM